MVGNVRLRRGGGEERAEDGLFLLQVAAGLIDQDAGGGRASGGDAGVEEVHEGLDGEDRGALEAPGDGVPLPLPGLIEGEAEGGLLQPALDGAFGDSGRLGGGPLGAPFKEHGERAALVVG